MPQTIRDLMTESPLTVDATATVADAAEAMRDCDIGAVIVREDGRISGVLTDRDIVVRAVAERRNPEAVRVREICSHELATIAADDSVDQAVQARIVRWNVRRVRSISSSLPSETRLRSALVSVSS